MPHLIVCLWDNLVISVRLVPQGFLCQTLGILRVAIKNVCIKKVKVFISLPTLSSFFKILPKFQTYYMFLPCWAQTEPGDGTTDRSSFWHNIWRVVRSSSSTPLRRPRSSSATCIALLVLRDSGSPTDGTLFPMLSAQLSSSSFVTLVFLIRVSKSEKKTRAKQFLVLLGRFSTRVSRSRFVLA